MRNLARAADTERAAYVNETAARRNVPAAVRQRLLTLSQRRRVKPFDLVLVRHSIDWLFARLSR